MLLAVESRNSKPEMSVFFHKIFTLPDFFTVSIPTIKPRFD